MGEGREGRVERGEMGEWRWERGERGEFGVSNDNDHGESLKSNISLKIFPTQLACGYIWHAVTRQCHSECVHNIRSAFMLYGHGLLIAKIFRKFDVSTRDIS